MPNTQIFIIEDHEAIRTSYERIIQRETDMDVCGTAQSGAEAFAQLDGAAPDLILVDISLPGPNGIEVLKRLRITHPELPVLIVSGHNEEIYARQALQAGASGYVDKLGLAMILPTAIRRILQGETYISENLRDKLQSSLDAK